MKELQIPYIGVKIESLPTILKIVEQSHSDTEFIDYYTAIGKSPKTASEYLASLRNLKLAKKGNERNTRLLPAGKMMINEEIENLYISLLTHCLKNFPDLHLVKDIVLKDKASTLNEVYEALHNKGNTVKRKQTLSSYLKLIIEGSKKGITRIPTYHSNIFEKEQIEFNQFLKLVDYFFFKSNIKKSALSDLYTWMVKKNKINREVFLDYLKILKSGNRYRLIEVNSRVISNTNEVFEINGRLLYYIEKSI